MNKLLNPEPCPVFMFRMQWKICGEPDGVSYARTKSRMANFVIEQGYSDRSRTPGLIQVCKVHPELFILWIILLSYSRNKKPRNLRLFLVNKS